MITVTAIQDVQVGKEMQLEALMKALTVQVLNEPGCISFEYFRSQESKNMYLVIEKYKNQEALTFHQKTDYLKAFIPKMMTCLKQAPVVVIYENVFSNKIDKTQKI